MESGIYCIENKVNGKKYIGRDSNLPKRWVVHLRKLKNKEHISTYLQNAWNKHGEENFKYYIIEECDKTICSERESFYISKLNTKIPNGYNLTDGGEGMVGYKPSKKTRLKMSNSQTGRKHSEETKLKIAKANTGKIFSIERRNNMSKANSGKKSAWFGRKHTEEEKIKIGNAHRGKIVSAETRLKLSVAGKGRKSWNKGIPRTDEEKRKISEAKIGKGKGIPKSEETKQKMRHPHKKKNK